MKNLLSQKSTSNVTTAGPGENLPHDPAGQAVLIEQPTSTFTLSSNPQHTAHRSISPDKNKTEAAKAIIYNEYFSGLEVIYFAVIWTLIFFSLLLLLILYHIIVIWCLRNDCLGRIN